MSFLLFEKDRAYCRLARQRIRLINQKGLKGNIREEIE